jgi:hypothetical protein
MRLPFCRQWIWWFGSLIGWPKLSKYEAAGKPSKTFHAGAFNLATGLAEYSFPGHSVQSFFEIFFKNLVEVSEEGTDP